MKIEGVLPALVTPLTDTEELNKEVLKQLIEYHVTQGAYGFYIGGATGEGLALRREVREELAEESIKTIAGRGKAIVHIASMDFSDALALARHAEKVGADMISALPPIFNAYDEDDVFAYYKTLAEATSLPMMVYYNPNAGFPIKADFAARLFEIDNVTAIKWTSSDYYGMVRLKDMTNGEMNIVNGPDEMLLMGLSAGADGGIGTTYNFQLPTVRRVYECFRAGDTAGALEAQQKADRAISVLLSYKIIPATKAVLSRMGFDVGNAAFPQKRYTVAQQEEIFRRITEAVNNG